MTQLVLIGFIVILASNHSLAALSCSPYEAEDSCPSDCLSDYCPTDEHQDQSPCVRPTNCPEPRCKCLFNYRYARNGTCIPVKECPPFDCKGQHERYDDCPPYCPSDDCSQATPDGSCPLLGNILIVVRCQPACRCIKGYWRKNGVCVPYDECPK